MPGLNIGQRSNAVHAGVIPEIDQHHATAQLPEAQRSRVQPYAPNLRRAHFPFFHSHEEEVSSFRPTSLAQCCTRSWCSLVNAAGKWLSMSSSPAILPCTKTGT